MKILNQNKLNEILKNYSGRVDDNPAIFVADYASYNEGHICGCWFDLTEFSDKDEFMDKIQEFFEELDEVAPLDFDMPREEFMFQDYQCIPTDMVGESHIDERFWEYLEFIKEDPENEELIEAYLSCFVELPDPISKIQERIYCKVDESSMRSFEARIGDHAIDQGFIEVPDHLIRYFDEEAYGRDIACEMYTCDPYVFDPNA